MIQRLVLPTAIASVLLTGTIFGFFYAWVCSTMWGLDAADPKVAIAAMQAMNASVRNAIFAPAFFFTPIALLLTAILALNTKSNTVTYLFGFSGTVYLLFGLVLTMFVNVPMNNALALVIIPEAKADAQVLWNVYSHKWQFWNITRTVFSGIALVLASLGLYRLGVDTARSAGKSNLHSY